ncbi:MAG: hypothetical protein HQL32_00805 [Planctomycetes bacterium]|nr:hypothetical protein [Planctomycetota bacterium]
MEQIELSEKVDAIKDVLDRSALYRHSLSPVFLFCGCAGLFASGLALVLNINQATGILLYWMALALLTASVSLALLMRQAHKNNEIFWQGPIKRMATAVFPPLLVGAMGGIYCLYFFPDSTFVSGQAVIAWMALYGLALNSASIVLAKNIRLLGWVFIIGSLVTVFLFELELEKPYLQHLTMGLSFGLLHLLQGVKEWRANG